MSAEDDDRLKDEIEALEAILMDEVTVQYNECNVPDSISAVLYPSTANDPDQQYVRVKMDVKLPIGYPDIEPIVTLKNPRGLDDDTLNDIHRDVRDKCLEFVGQPVIFELINLIREKLTASNVPSCICAVCLYGFQPSDHFTKTECYHYFHSYCLRCHITNTERVHDEEQDKLPAWQRAAVPFEATCPVCREPVRCDVAALHMAPVPVDVENARKFEASDELRALQKQMAALYLYQQSRGGIIDVQAEENRMLLVTGSLDEEEEVRVEECAAASQTPAPVCAPKKVHKQAKNRGFNKRKAHDRQQHYRGNR